MIRHDDKVELARKRAELVTSLAGALPTDERVRIQDDLRVINAKIKAANTTEAAQLKAAADRRKAAGLAEAQANAARARANAGQPDVPEDTEDDDPGQIAAIDGWIDAVLLRHDVEFTRPRNGTLKISIDETSSNLAGVMYLLIKGVYAAARGQELPDLPAAPAKVPKAKPKKR